MKGKLIKLELSEGYRLDDEKGNLIASTLDGAKTKLSHTNCDDIFGVINVENLAEDFAKNNSIYPTAQDDTEYGFKNGFNKAMELNKDKVFTLEDMMNCWNKALKFQEHKETLGEHIQSLQQPTEIEVEIEMECKIGCEHLVLNGENSLCCGNKVPKLDSNGCLILKKI